MSCVYDILHNTLYMVSHDNLLYTLFVNFTVLFNHIVYSYMCILHFGTCAFLILIVLKNPVINYFVNIKNCKI